MNNNNNNNNIYTYIKLNKKCFILDEEKLKGSDEITRRYIEKYSIYE